MNKIKLYCWYIVIAFALIYIILIYFSILLWLGLAVVFIFI